MTNSQNPLLFLRGQGWQSSSLRRLSACFRIGRWSMKATSATERAASPIAVAICLRNRRVIRDRAGACATPNLRADLRGQVPRPK